MSEAAPATTLDRFLDGRLVIEQPAEGRHRAGLDALLLAATVPAEATGLLVDLGAGVGTAGLAAALAAPDLAVHLTERDPEALRLAARNVAANGLADRVTPLAVDLLAPARAREAILPRECATHVICNPPFYVAGAVRASPRADRAAAHVLGQGGVEDWIRVAAATLAPHGSLALIFRGDGIADLLAALAGRFGAASILPVHPRAEDPAHRLIVTAIKGSRARPLVLPGLVLHPAGANTWLDRADALLRGAARLDLRRPDVAAPRRR